MDYNNTLIVNGSWLWPLFSSAAIYVVNVAIYRLTFHPLAHYPGPLIARTTSWYYTYHCWRGDMHLVFYQCHLKYGPVVRYGPNQVAFNTSTALQTIYGFKANVRKSNLYHQFSSPAGPSVFSAVSKEQHARKRKILASAFSDRSLHNMNEFFLMHIRTFCGKLGTGQPLNMSDWSRYLAFDIMGELTFGKTFGMLQDSGNRFVAVMAGKVSGVAVLRANFPTLSKIGMDKFLFPNLSRSIDKFNKFAEEQAAERTKMTSERSDFYHLLTTATDPDTGDKYSDRELWGEANALIAAGTNSSASTLATVIFYLLHNPSTLEKATKEVRIAFTDLEEIAAGPLLSGCHYLRACIDEAQRCSPSVTAILPRTVLSGGIEIDGHHIDTGTEVGVSTYAIHHNEEYYPESFCYLPERWIAADSSRSEKAKVDITHKAFAAFSLGPRGCIGRNMAYVTLVTTLSRILFQFEMRLRSTLGEGHPDLGQRKDEFQLTDHFNGHREGPIVEFRATEP